MNPFLISTGASYAYFGEGTGPIQITFVSIVWCDGSESTLVQCDIDYCRFYHVDAGVRCSLPGICNVTQSSVKHIDECVV